MSRFTLTQLFMGTALVAILLVFTQTEGCGRSFTLVECVSFSTDGSRIAVSKLNARDAQTPGKLYMTDVRRNSAAAIRCAVDKRFERSTYLPEYNILIRPKTPRGSGRRIL